jgi:hypothetical protein
LHLKCSTKHVILEEHDHYASSSTDLVWSLSSDWRRPNNDPRLT